MATTTIASLLAAALGLLGGALRVEAADAGADFELAHPRDLGSDLHAAESVPVAATADWG